MVRIGSILGTLYRQLATLRHLGLQAKSAGQVMSEDDPRGACGSSASCLYSVVLTYVTSTSQSIPNGSEWISFVHNSESKIELIKIQN